jgi:poly(3-hydroxybutyrate) depolymerase
MNKRSLAAAVLVLGSVTLSSACSSDGGSTPTLGGVGSGNTGAGGGAAAGAAPVGGAGAPTGAGSGGAAALGAGAGGDTAQAAGAGGQSISGGGAAGAAGSAGAANPSAGAGGGGATIPPGKGQSAGCNMPAPGTDSSTTWVKHDIEVTGVDPAWISAHPVPADHKYTWTHRNYFMKLPKTYNQAQPYQLSIGGSGCGGSETVGSEGGYALPNTNEIQVALSYVTANSACFADDAVNTPDLPYFDAVIADLEAKFCIDKSKIFVHGYSSGAWETYMLGCARAGVIRGIFTSQGGERVKRPACSGPVAALLSAGANASNDNPIGPLDPNSGEAKSLDSLGSAVARDEILMRNGCTGTATVTWSGSAECKQYTGCPAAYPVIWCPINGGHEYASQLAAPAETFFQGLSTTP